MKIETSNKHRITTTCAYQGCPWKVCASLCTDVHSFEVRKLDATHMCHGVNIARKEQATVNWVAHEIKKYYLKRT